jgi:putative tryptophan/tyrosine transport system substrate-binding protein
MSDMKRREFLAFFGGAAAAAWPLAARAQQAQMPVIGFLTNGSPDSHGPMAAGFRRGLAESGFVEGQNVAIEYRWAEGKNDRLPVLANDLVRAQAAVIFAGGPPTALAVKAATSAIPIVFTSGEDPIKMGLVASFNRPGGNVTGIVVLIDVLGAKRLGLLRDLVPTGTLIAVLLNPDETSFETQLKDVQDAARMGAQQIHVLRASTEPEIDLAFATAKELKAGAMLVGVNFFYTLRREQIAMQAARAAIPVIYGQREFISAGGLMSYAANLVDAHREAGIYAGRILKGARPADLPVVQVSKLDLVINLKTARTLGLTIPPGIMAIADEVIE